MMKLLIVASLVVLASLAVVAQPNTPASYNRAGNHQSSNDPCADINIQYWQDVGNRVTVDANFDDSVPADYASVWTGQDQFNLYPNGFRKGQVYEDNNPPFCFNVGGVGNKQVQVMIQTVDEQARLCIKDTTSTGVRMGGTIDRCFTEKHIACFGGLTYGNTLSLMIYTDSKGSTTSTAFWYRVRVSGVAWDLTNPADRADSAIQTLEMWCMMQDQAPLQMRFPKELRSVVPPELVVAGPQNAALAQSASVLVVLALAIATLLAILKQ